MLPPGKASSYHQVRHPMHLRWMFILKIYHRGYDPSQIANDDVGATFNRTFFLILSSYGRNSFSSFFILYYFFGCLGSFLLLVLLLLFLFFFFLYFAFWIRSSFVLLFVALHYTFFVRLVLFCFSFSFLFYEKPKKGIEFRKKQKKLKLHC